MSLLATAGIFNTLVSAGSGVTFGKLVSGSLAADTGMRVSIGAGEFTSDDMTVAFWWKHPNASGGNDGNTVFASQTGEYQIYSGGVANNNKLQARLDGAVATALVTAPGSQGDWVFVYAHIGRFYDATNNATITLTDGTTTNSASQPSGAGSTDDITAAHTLYILCDDNNGAASDDGFIGEVFDFCILDGIISAGDLQHDGSGNWQDLSATGEAALVRRFAGTSSGNAGYDETGTGNATVENSGVSVSYTDLPSGANP